jgi:hypothetical protein
VISCESFSFYRAGRADGLSYPGPDAIRGRYDLALIIYMNFKINIMQTIKYNKSKNQYIISTLSKNKQIINLEILTKLCNKTQSLLKLNNNWQTTSFLLNYVKINNDYYLQEFDFDYVD